jgi:hypothetical protein
MDSPTRTAAERARVADERSQRSWQIGLFSSGISNCAFFAQTVETVKSDLKAFEIICNLM